MFAIVTAVQLSGRPSASKGVSRSSLREPGRATMHLTPVSAGSNVLLISSTLGWRVASASSFTSPVDRVRFRADNASFLKFRQGNGNHNQAFVTETWGARSAPGSPGSVRRGFRHQPHWRRELSRPNGVKLVDAPVMCRPKQARRPAALAYRKVDRGIIGRSEFEVRHKLPGESKSRVGRATSGRLSIESI
jgi:hypothetical protein